MFKLTYRPTYNRDNSRTDYFNDTKDLANFVLSLTNNKAEADNCKYAKDGGSYFSF